MSSQFPSNSSNKPNLSTTYGDSSNNNNNNNSSTSNNSNLTNTNSSNIIIQPVVPQHTNSDEKLTPNNASIANASTTASTKSSSYSNNDPIVFPPDFGMPRKVIQSETSDNPTHWSCEHCTFLNKPDLGAPMDRCEVCSLPRSSTIIPHYNSRDLRSNYKTPFSSSSSSSSSLPQTSFSSSELPSSFLSSNNNNDNNDNDTSSELMMEILKQLQPPNQQKIRTVVQQIAREVMRLQYTEPLSQVVACVWCCPSCTAENDVPFTHTCLVCFQTSLPRQSALQLIKKICQNILNDPISKRYRKLKSDKIIPRLEVDGGTLCILKNLGFVETGEYVLLPDNMPLTSLEDCINCINLFTVDPAYKGPGFSASPQVLVLATKSKHLTQRELSLLKVDIFLQAAQQEQEDLKQADLHAWIQLCHLTATYFQQEKNEEEALLYYNRVLTVATKSNTPKIYALIMRSLSHIYRQRTVGDAQENQRLSQYYEAKIDLNDLNQQGCGHPNCLSCQDNTSHKKTF